MKGKWSGIYGPIGSKIPEMWAGAEDAAHETTRDRRQSKRGNHTGLSYGVIA
ncbi:hypothetical protein [Siminovitchia fordii]|uniref:hypothetical protein n=1 Tax=Siminovitchia fordii TaxID=254759 RepID=UPI00037838A0|nr:hypothetical protein [Siminovitchia fordii]